ncbi:class I SAM-dependent methyltransferase [bacterium]|nr:class I SAM-dependent methyltransferase [bacterium]NCQ54923.1 class I SAM-dependent methyltransferase [Candidatus Parcubacteria bacterium]NCS66967.1 class I SAM-dependent methyltransferase [Candidatus Peregrinibacteria bacterium]NCS95913.1 class I SAM-dependent methyltransferase [bacterium]
MMIDFLLIALLVVLLMGTVFWTYLLVFMFRYKVPLISTSKTVINQALEFAEIKPGQTVFELGCGWAPFLFTAAKAEPNAKYIGVEVLKPILWINRFKAKNQPIEFINQDFFTLDLSQADVIYCYLWDTIMADIYTKKWSTLKPGFRLISYDFPIKKLTPKKTVKLGKSTLYLYVKK